MKLLFFIIFWFAFIDLSVCLDAETIKYRNCNTSVSECGSLENLRYPFWGMGRPQHCGLPRYNLDCYEGYSPVIYIKYTSYRVLKMDQQNKIMKIFKSDHTSRSQCSSDSFTQSLDFRRFRYTDRVAPITLLTGCNQSFRYNLLDIKHFWVFHCVDIPGGNDTGGYYLGTKSLNRIPRENLPSCTDNFSVPVMKTNLDKGYGYDIPQFVKEGFEISYDVVADISNCKICEKSGGECGYDTGLQQATCFCPDGRSTRTSERNWITLRCADLNSGGNNSHTNLWHLTGRGHLEKKIVIGTSTAVSSILVLLLLVLVIFLRKKHMERRKDQQIVEGFFMNPGSLALKRYTYFEVKKMTNSFKEKLGQGGYGSVFKGKLNDGRLVAVKLLFTNSKNNGEEFINEVESISRTSHVNVVNLLGFCLKGKKRALIYEFMPNGSLEKFIYNNMSSLTSGDHHPQLSLGRNTLYQIAVGIARGLEYLHRGCNTQILHFDIKPHNILLDEKFCPKIADFGLAKLCTRNESMISFLGTRGTTGYIAPEVFSRNYGGVSYKSDVYSYGMMILEMVGGRKNIDVGVGMDHSSQIYYPHWIYERLTQNEHLVLHWVIMTEASEEIARKMSIVGLWCIQANPTNRPSMTKVLEMLEGKSETLEIPPKPFFSSPSRPSPVPLQS